MDNTRCKRTPARITDKAGVDDRQPVPEMPGADTRTPGGPGHSTTCSFSGFCQVVMSSDLQKRDKKNKQHA
jgi:hypothetical protein